MRRTPLLLIPARRDLRSVYGRFARATAPRLSPELRDAVDNLLPEHLRTDPTEARLYLPPVATRTNPRWLSPPSDRTGPPNATAWPKAAIEGRRGGPTATCSR